MTMRLQFCDSAPGRRASNAWWLGSLSNRQVNGEDRPLAQLAFDLQQAPVVIDNMFNDREPEAGATELPGAGRVDPVEALGQPRNMLAEDALAVIADRDQRGGRARKPPGRDAGAHLHGGSGPAVFDRVVDQVLEHLVELVGVARHLRKA